MFFSQTSTRVHQILIPTHNHEVTPYCFITFKENFNWYSCVPHQKLDLETDLVIFMRAQFHNTSAVNLYAAPNAYFITIHGILCCTKAIVFMYSTLHQKNHFHTFSHKHTTPAKSVTSADLVILGNSLFMSFRVITLVSEKHS